MNKAISFRSEQRQHISLSKHAYDVLLADSYNFFGEKNMSGCINRIIENYWEESIASISLSAVQAQDTLHEYLLIGKQNKEKPGSRKYTEAGPDSSLITDQEAAVLHLITEGRVKNENRRLLSYPKDYSLKIRLNNTVYDLLYPEDADQWPEHQNYVSQGAYIKAILEDYARRSPFDREGIFYISLLEQLDGEINKAGSEKRILEIAYTAASGMNTRFLVKPYKLSDENQGDFHYLIGLSSPAGTEKPDFQPHAIRISRITGLKARARSFGSGNITQEQQKTIEKKIEQNGVAFFIGETDHCKVKLSPNGMKLFQNILHLRPQPISRIPLSDGYTELDFDCTKAQIRYYFTQFCSDAIVVYPGDLAAEMREQYEKAASTYLHALSKEMALKDNG